MDSEWRQTLTEYIELQQRFDETRKSGVLRAREIHAPFDSVRERWDESSPHSIEDSKAMSQLLKEYGRRRREHGIKMANLADSIILRNEEYRMEMLALCNEAGSAPIEAVIKMRDHLQEQIELFTSVEESIFEYDELVDRFNDLMEKRASKPDPTSEKKKFKWW
jgi:hypothetical protein